MFITPNDQMADTAVVRNQKAAARRLYVRGIFSGFKRGQRVQHENTSLLKLEGVYNKDDAKFYLGKRAVYVFKAHKKVAKGGHEKTRVRAIWGRVTRVHGNSGTVRAKFHHNLPPSAMGKRVRVMLYPSNI
ncbi:Ribosomal protein L35Ae domain containing protein [Aphelenchoides besseyi]|nr:Ribosomal protein L35Ae domain containing protein [Aphelenchoides besseyi]KAI6194057.1 Ribosomal protein L35Ae domain containing protein [Aphelenchoides besseyi]